MASFKNSPKRWELPDWEYLQDGFVTLFMAPKGFKEAKRKLARVGYVVVELDASRWDDDDALYDDTARAFSFPDYFGRNVPALRDCLRDVATFAYGSDPKATGTAVAINHIEVLYGRDPEMAQLLLDILADTGRQALLIGHRFFVLARSGDPRLNTKIADVGATPVSWNQREWLDTSRGV